MVNLVNSIVNFFDLSSLTSEERDNVIIGFACLFIPGVILLSYYKAKHIHDSPEEVKATANKVSEIENPIKPSIPEKISDSPVIENAEVTSVMLEDNIKVIKEELNLMPSGEAKKAILQVVDDISDPEVLFGPLPQDEKGKQRVLKIREKYQIAFNKACVQRELRKKGKLVQPLHLEKLTLKQLGLKYDPKYGDKEFLYDVICSMAKEEIEEANPKSIEDAVKFISQIALKVRLKQVGLTDPKKIEKFKVMRDFYDQLLDRLKNEILPIEIPPNKFPQQSKMLKDQFQEVMQTPFFTDSLNDHRAFFLEYYNDDSCEMEPEVLEEMADAHIAKIKEDWNAQKSFDETTKEIFIFFREFESNLSYEMAQGYKPDDVLGTGICHALVMELLEYGLDEPKVGGENLKPEINENTRYKHARFKVKRNLAKGLDRIGRNEGLDPMGLDIYFYNTNGLRSDIRKFFDRDRDNFEKSNGWLYLGLSFSNSNEAQAKLKESKSHEEYLKTIESSGPPPIEKSGHACGVRVQEGKYEFFDPNVGHFVFKGADGKEKLSKCIDSVFQLFYPNLAYVYFEQYVKPDLA